MLADTPRTALCGLLSLIGPGKDNISLEETGGYTFNQTHAQTRDSILMNSLHLYHQIISYTNFGTRNFLSFISDS